jgi:hypothetical protein
MRDILQNGAAKLRAGLADGNSKLVRSEIEVNELLNDLRATGNYVTFLLDRDEMSDAEFETLKEWAEVTAAAARRLASEICEERIAS